MPRARPGWEWLLTALLVYLNYHLLHRLYRTVAFYKMHDVWHLKYDQLNDGNISYQDTFKMCTGEYGLTPERSWDVEAL